MTINPYTCRLLRRIDGVIWRLRGSHVEWSKVSGHLNDHMGELPSHFPGWMYIAAAKIQNRWFWTRRFLSW